MKFPVHGFHATGGVANQSHRLIADGDGVQQLHLRGIRRCGDGERGRNHDRAAWLSASSCASSSS